MTIFKKTSRQDAGIGHALLDRVSDKLASLPVKEHGIRFPVRICIGQLADSHAITKLGVGQPSHTRIRGLPARHPITDPGSKR